jgi:GNAT superfamily N-acetyltransferase
MTPALPHPVALQPATRLDQPLLLRLFVEQRSRIFATAGMDEQQVEAMLQSQFEFRAHSYAQQYPVAEDRILVTDDGERIGRILIDWSEDGVCRLIDFAILGSHQGLGIGTSILERCIEEAALHHCRLQLTVDRSSRAEHLYTRKGFTIKDETPLQRHMEYLSDPITTSISHPGISNPGGSRE